jgi:predicted secreted Zn-dependent protease
MAPRDYPQAVRLSRLTALLLPLALAAVTAVEAPAAPPPAIARVAHATMVYYAVGGTTPEQIRARLNARAPASPDGFHGDAFTRWSFRWQWPGSTDGRCRVKEATVTLKIDVSFPRWTHPKAASAATAAAWARYARALARHERGTSTSPAPTTQRSRGPSGAGPARPPTPRGRSS